MKTLVVTGISVAVLEKVDAMNRLSQLTPFINRFPKAGRIGLDVAGIVVGGTVAVKGVGLPEKFSFLGKGAGAGLAIHSVIDLLEVAVPNL